MTQEGFEAKCSVKTEGNGTERRPRQWSGYCWKIIILTPLRLEAQRLLRQIKRYRPSLRLRFESLWRFPPKVGIVFSYNIKLIWSIPSFASYELRGSLFPRFSRLPSKKPTFLHSFEISLFCQFDRLISIDFFISSLKDIQFRRSKKIYINKIYATK